MPKQTPATEKSKNLRRRTPSVSPEQRDLLIRHFLESLNTPVSLGVWLRYLHK